VVRGAAPVVRALCESVHGPVIASLPGMVFTLKTAVRGFEVEGMEAFHHMMRATSYTEFDQAVAGAIYNFNVLYADARGNIAYWHAGRIPQPATGDPLWLPRRQRRCRMAGCGAFDHLPRHLPDRGYLVSWKIWWHRNGNTSHRLSECLARCSVPTR
jgi:penicillin amidase